MQEILAKSLGQEDALKEESATHSSGLVLCFVSIIRNLNDEPGLQKIVWSLETLPVSLVNFGNLALRDKQFLTGFYILKRATEVRPIFWKFFILNRWSHLSQNNRLALLQNGFVRVAKPDNCITLKPFYSEGQFFLTICSLVMTCYQLSACSSVPSRSVMTTSLQPHGL